MIRSSHAAPRDTLARPADWGQFAACLTEDPDLFYPQPGDTRGINQAKRVCASCLVRADCLEDALKDEGGRGKDGRHGIRAGLTGDERYLLHARRRAARRNAA